MAATFFGYAIVPTTDDGTNTADPTSITPPSSMEAGDLVILVATARAVGLLTTYPQITNNGGQSWSEAAAEDTGSNTGKIFWCRYDGTWDANPSVTFNDTSCNTLSMLVFRPTTGTNIWTLEDGTATSFTAPSSPYTVTISSRTTTNACVVVGVWTTQDNNTWGSLSGTGWSKTSLPAQERNSSGQDFSHTWAYNIQTSAGATNAVSQNQATLGGDQGNWFRLCFYESSAPIDIVPDQTGYQTQLGDNAALTQVHNITADQTGYQTQLGDNATLGVTIDLVPDSTGYQTQLGDNATIEVSSVIDLVPDQTGYQSQAGDSTTLATELKHTVAPSGGDFTSLDAALDHLVSAHPNLVTANVFAVIEIQGSWSSADTTLASTAGITMDESHPIIIRANSANRASAQGWRTDRYRLSVSGGDKAIYLTGAGGAVHIHLDGLQIELTGVTSTGVTAVHCDGAAPGSTLKVSNVRARMACESAGSGFIFGFADADPIYTVWNLIAEPHPSNAGTVRGYYLSGPGTSGSSKAFNCLAVNLNYGYRTASTDSWSIYDSIAVNCGDDFYNAIGDFYEVDNCASDDNEGTNNVAESGGGTWWPNDFIDAQNGDYRLKSTSNLVGAATHNLGGNATDDIDGQTRSDYDLGPSESVVVDMVPDSTGYQTQLGDNATLEVLGGAIDLVPDQTGYQTQLGDSPTLGVTIDLVPDSTGYQTQLGDSPTLGVTIDLVPDGTGYQTQLGDSPTLGVTIDLVPDSTGYQTQLGDNTTIEVGIIAIEPDQTGYQTQLGDNATLGVTIDLVPDSTGYQTQLGDNATLTINAIDIVPDQTGYQSQLGDNAVIERIFNLIASEGSQTQLGDEATLDLILNLLIQEGSQTQAGDEAVLIQIHNLLADEGYQTQFGDEGSIITGELKDYQFIQRVLIGEFIKKFRVGQMTGDVGSQLVLNPDFENWTGQNPDNWTKSISGGGGGGAVLYSISYKVSGERSVYMNSGNGQDISVYQSVSLVEGQRYIIGGWMRSSAGSSSHIDLEAPDGSHLTDLGGWTPTYVQGAIVVTTIAFGTPVWTFGFVDFIAPTTGSYVFSCKNGINEPSMTHFFDLVELVEFEGIRGYLERSRVHSRMEAERIRRVE